MGFLIPDFFKNCLDSTIRVVAAAKDLSKNPVHCGSLVLAGMCGLPFSEAEKVWEAAHHAETEAYMPGLPL